MHCLQLESPDEDNYLQIFYESFICMQGNGLNNKSSILVDHTIMQAIQCFFVSSLNIVWNWCEYEMKIPWTDYEYIVTQA